eukprot:2063818-Rhodomonas_salina.1
MLRQSPRECAGSVEMRRVLTPSSASFTPARSFFVTLTLALSSIISISSIVVSDSWSSLE